MNVLLRVLKGSFAVLLFPVLLHLPCLKFTLKEKVVNNFHSAFKKILPVILEMYKYTEESMYIYKAHTHTYGLKRGKSRMHSGRLIYF